MTPAEEQTVLQSILEDHTELRARCLSVVGLALRAELTYSDVEKVLRREYEGEVARRKAVRQLSEHADPERRGPRRGGGR